MQNNYLMLDSEAIGQTASVLGVSQTRVFELAYQEWYGQPFPQREMEAVFLAYLFEGRLPCWVRAFTRNTLVLCEEAGMDLPQTQTGHNMTLSVNQPEMILALLGVGVVSLIWLMGLI
jgi:hypothetical protein